MKEKAEDKRNTMTGLNAEGDLQESQSLFQSFFDSPGVMRGIVEIVDDTTVRHIIDNQATAGFVGLTPEAMRNKLSSEMGEPPEIIRTWVKHYRESQQTGKPVTFEYLDKRGEQQAWLSATVSWIGKADNGKERFAYLVLDITERKKTEEDLSLREERFRMLIENLRSGVALIDEQGQFNTVNSSFLKMFGLSKDSSILNINSQDWSSWLVYEEDGKTLLPVDEHPVRKAARTALPVREKLVGVRLPSGGEPVWLIINAQPVFKPDNTIQYLIATYYDITERKKVEETLKTNNERLSILSEANSLLLSSEDPEKIVQTIASKVMVHLNCDCFFNFIVDESAGKLRLNAYAGIPEDTAKGIEWLDYGVAICGCAARDGCRIVSEDIQENGDTRAALVRSFGVQAYACHPLTVGSKVIGTLSFGTRSRTTFTEDELGLMKTIAAQVSVAMARKLAEDDLRRYAAELESANKDLASFSYTISHDLRAPLRSMDGYSSALLEDYADKLDEQGKKWLQNIRASSVHMGRLIDDILGLSMVVRAELKFRKVNLSEIVRSQAARLLEAEPGRQIELVIAPGMEAVGDSNLLGLVLQNLLSNAFKFTSKSQSARIEFGLDRQNGHKVYFLRDNGAGFDMKYVDKLFKPFQRLHSDREYPGTGIGLVTVQRIIQRHGGMVWAEGEVDKGATFYFTLDQDRT